MAYFLHSISPVTRAGAVLRQKAVNKFSEVFWRVPFCWEVAVGSFSWEGDLLSLL